MKLFQQKTNRTLKTAILAITLTLLTGLAVCKVTLNEASALSDAEADADMEKAREQIKEIYTEEYQDAVSERLEKAKSGGTYTEESMLIEGNPYGTNTLSLYVYFTTEMNAQVSYIVSVEETSIGDFSVQPASESEAKTEHEFQVIGLIPESENTIVFNVVYEDGTEKSYEQKYNVGQLSGTEEVQLEVETMDTSMEAGDGLYVILGNDSDGLDFMYYYDSNGVLRSEIPIIDYRSHRLLFKDDLMYYSISETKIAAMNEIGKVETVYDTGDYKLHHDYVFDDNGDLLVLATDTTQNTVEDQIISIDTETGEIKYTFDLEELFGEYKEKFTDSDAEELDWMHINTIQYLGEETVILSSRETSSILKLSGIFSDPVIDYIIGEENFWDGTGYEEYVMEKDENEGTFSGTGGQHTVTYVEDESLEEGQYYLYLFNNNLGVSESREYDWEQIDGIATSLKSGQNSYYYKYLVDETEGTYKLVQSFEVPFSGYVSSVQEHDACILVNSGMQGIFSEYDAEGNIIKRFQMELSDEYIYRVYKYDFKGFLFM